MEPDEAEALRRRLYRRGASAADLAGYLEATEAPAAPERPPSAPAARRSPRALVAGIAVVGAAAAACVAVALGEARIPSAPPPTAAGRTVRLEAGTGRVVVHDSGSRAGAGGTSVAEGPGRYRYTVDAGDTVAGIAGRFGLCRGDLLVALPSGFDAGELPAGSTLLLRRYVSTPPTSAPSGTC